ncbi:MAG: 6-bladed beta-propeller [Gemmatimonadetes bacterium]|nr:6-bladed beta-propeller [Gemmatimonadota bacterium]
MYTIHYSVGRRAKRSSGDAALLECRGRFVHGLLVLLSVGFLCSAVAACNDAKSERDVQARNVVQISDSAGITDISLGRVEELAAPELAAELVFSTRGLGIELFWVGDALLLGNGRLAVANTGESEVLIFSADGSLATRVGGEGEGPGEFSEITTLLATEAGFLVYDSRLARLSEFAETGRFLTSTRLDPESAIVSLRPLATDTAGHVLAILGEQRFFLPEGMKRDTTPLLSFTNLGAEPETLGLLPAKEWSYGSIPGGGATRSEPAFGRDIVAKGFGDRALIGDTDVLSLSVYGADGRLTRRIRGTGGGWAVTAEEIEASRAERLARLGSDAPEWYRQSVENAPHRDTHPAFHSALLGPDEMVWIGLAARLGEETRRWLVIGADGQLRGWLALPATASVLAVDADRFATLLRDANDEEEVRLYSLGPSRR